MQTTATDIRRLLGTKTITCANCELRSLPFGAIDTPGQGEVVSGVVNNFGWVLAPGNSPRRSDPGGGTVRVVIDGVACRKSRPVGPPAPISRASFPVASYKGIATALGVFTFDSRTLTNGIHTIAWAVTDNMGGTCRRRQPVLHGRERVGFYRGVDRGKHGVGERGNRCRRAGGTTPLVGRHGYDLDAPWRNYRANSAGVVVVQSEELDRIELYTQATSGSLVTANGLRHLPIGASLDGGVFTWQPGAGFVGSYDFLFTGPAGDRQVRIVLNPKGSGRVGPQVVIDTPSRSTKGLVAADQPFVIAGWAADLGLDGRWRSGRRPHLGVSAQAAATPSSSDRRRSEACAPTWPRSTATGS